MGLEDAHDHEGWWTVKRFLTILALALVPAAVHAQSTVVPGRNYLAALDGSATLPTRTYQNDTDLGAYRIGANNEGFTAGGTLRFDYNASRVNFAVPVYLPAGTAALPSLALASAPTTGLIYSGASVTGAFDLVRLTSIKMRLGDGSAGPGYGITLAASGQLAWNYSTIAQNTDTVPDLFLVRQADGVLGLQRDTTHGVTFNVATDSTIKLFARDGTSDASFLAAVITATAGGFFRTNGGSNTAASGVFRARNSEALAWRNNANSGDLTLTVNTSDQFSFLGPGGADSAIVKANQLVSTGKIQSGNGNANAFYALNSAAASKHIIGINASDLVLISGDGAVSQFGGSIKMGDALVSLGGGAAPTLGTIGGSGPASAAQNSWAKFIDSTGATFWVPVWK